MSNEIVTQQLESENSDEETANVSEPSEEVKFDYRKAREERIIRNTERRILKDLGEHSFEEIKEKLKSRANAIKELETQKNNGRKFNVLSSGFDDQFVDFIVHDITRSLKDGASFDDALEKYKKTHPQFLRNSPKGPMINTAPTFENNQVSVSSHARMNDFFRGKINKF